MFRIEYASRREELWWWYRKMWRRRFWKLHALCFCVVAATVFLFVDGSSQGRAMLCLGWGATAVVFMVVYPQLLFKPQMRIILVDEDGLKTTIGRKSGVRTWSELTSVEDEAGYLIVTCTIGNAFVIPPRAFATHEMRAHFASFLRSRVTGS
ncbi:MAG: YcxB family protein [Alphaproteobacteria bacterium]|nr:YcxB family protein [Alphaproteobacteria bacterium]